MNTVSIIIPTLNEDKRLPRLLDRLRDQGADEIIVSDGGSTDDTTKLAAAAGARVVTGARGRGQQLNLGASAASGEILWFLHADVLPPITALSRICEVMANPQHQVGAFLIHTKGEGIPPWKSALLRMADLRSRYTHRPYGDQGIFIRAALFEECGGFPSIPLMEDFAFTHALAGQHEFQIIREEIEVSGRRFLAQPVRSFVLMNAFPILFRAGARPETLAKIYGAIR